MKPLLFAIAIAALFTRHDQQEYPPVHNSYQHHITFKVDAVKPSDRSLMAQDYKTVLHGAFVENYLNGLRFGAGGPNDTTTLPNRFIECYSRERAPMIGVQTNGFFETVHYAYAQHHPLVLTPDMIWLVIAQGFARHINENSDALRQQVVRHEGKKVLEVDVTGRVQLGNDDSNWEFAFRQLHDSIAANTTADAAELVAGRFSGTNSDAAVAFDITLMDAMKTYFDYWAGIICGIPEITLEGTPEDWQQIEERAARLEPYGLDWWLKDLQPILAEFTQTAKGNPDRNFWKSIVKDIHEPICGGDTYITGWVIRLFPYVKKGDYFERNPILGLKTEDLYSVTPKKTVTRDITIDGKKVGKTEDAAPNFYNMCNADEYQWIQYTGPKVTTDEVPSGISTADLNINDNGVMHKMELKAGFVGFRQDVKSLALRPVIGWAIVETGEQPDMEARKRYEEQPKKH